MISKFTWRDVAVALPEIVQSYVQECGPVPDGDVTQEDWDAFYAWVHQQGGIEVHDD